MSKDPAILFYTSDFLTGTMTMTNEDVGKYIRLLCLQHQNGGYLYEEDIKNICSSSGARVISKFKKTSDGKYYNVRMKTEIDRRKRYCESRSKNRKKSKIDKNTYEKDMKNITPIYDKHMETENETENVIINKKKGDIKGGGNKKKKVEKIKYAEFVSMKESEYQKLLSEHGEKMTAACIEILDNYKGSKGKRYASDYRAILNWVIKRAREDGYKSEPIIQAPEMPDYLKEALEIDKKEREDFYDGNVDFANMGIGDMPW